MYAYLVLSAALLWLWGCTSTPPPRAAAHPPAFTVLLESEPPGAQLFLRGQPLGSSPRTINVAQWEEILDLVATLGDEKPRETRVRWLGSREVVVRYYFGNPTPLMQRLGLARVLVFDFSAKTTFDVDRSEIKPEFAEMLQVQAQLLRTHFPQLKFFVCGHADSSGGYQHNLQLSLQRATAVRDFLAAQGVPRANMTVLGLGPDYAETDNTTTEGRARNRRTELILPQI
ncbi:MAG: OmpA family protein [Thermoanaerobaculum sp.]|nr:OmpA family protein [Thermoanaerobaculum sp.]MDW7967293.1 OmpA family protein [Thermoanaerobaculum sp.]